MTGEQSKALAQAIERAQQSAFDCGMTDHGGRLVPVEADLELRVLNAIAVASVVMWAELLRMVA